MSQNIDYKAILKAYPETISKEQLYMSIPREIAQHDRSN